MEARDARTYGWAPLAAVALALASGCASAPRVAQMTAGPPGALTQSVPAPLRAAIAPPTVTGGQETNPLWTSEIGDHEFRLALHDSLARAGMLSLPPQTGAYLLQARLVKVDQPILGASMTVTVTVAYTLTRGRDQAVVWQETLTTPFRAAWNSHLYGVERLRIANEGAARANIEALMAALYRLDAFRLALSP